MRAQQSTIWSYMHAHAGVLHGPTKDCMSLKLMRCTSRIRRWNAA